MPRKKPTSQIKVSPATDASPSLVVETAVPANRSTPLVFISHDSRDADLAEAFDHLLSDSSGGVIQTFRSSDQSGRAGIDYGENWYSKITKTLADATDVVALLTANSVGRPWILFEAGFAVGRLDAKVFGIALGIPLSKAVAGPFAQFQNCEANEESLTNVVLKLIQRNPNAKPREQAVRKQTTEFLREVESLLKKRPKQEEETKEEMNATAIAKLFEEVKVMFRDLPSRFESELRENGVLRKRRRFHPMMMEEVFHLAEMEGADSHIAWLFLGSLLREENPTISESALELHRALQSGRVEQIERAKANLMLVTRLMRHGRFFSREDEETYRVIRHLPELMERFAPAVSNQRVKSRALKAETQGDSDKTTKAAE